VNVLYPVVAVTVTVPEVVEEVGVPDTRPLVDIITPVGRPVAEKL
jgi:hypothetical protein